MPISMLKMNGIEAASIGRFRGFSVGGSAGDSLACPKQNSHMRPKLLVIVIWFAVTGSFAFAQDEKTEVAVFGGGYFNGGFQSFKVLNPTTGAQVGTFKPVSEANSGNFGARGSYDFRSQMAAEVTFGFSPAGRSQNFSTSGFLTGVLGPTQIQPGIPITVRSPVL